MALLTLPRLGDGRLSPLPAWAWHRAVLSITRLLCGGVLVMALLLGSAAAAAAATELQVSEVVLEPCPTADPGSQPEQPRPSGASCWALRGLVVNPGSKPVIDTDVFGQILDASGEPVLPNRARVGSIGDVPPGRSRFALRLAVPAGTPGPLRSRSVKARGFQAPVRTRAGADDELLPLEQALEGFAPEPTEPA